MAGFLLVNKVYSPQYVLWLLPLAALARPRWRDLLIWQAGEVFYFATVWWYLGGYLDPGRRRRRRLLLGRDRGPGGRELYLVGVVVPRHADGPTHDPVRDGPSRSADDDPVERRGGVAHPDVDLVADLRAPARRAGRNSIEACMCGGSANSRCLPSMRNGERTNPAASRPPRASGRGAGLERLASPVGASRPMPWAVPPLTTSRWPALGAVRPR